MLQSIRPLVRENLAVGQYSGKGDAGQPGSKLGYLDDPSLQNKVRTTTHPASQASPCTPHPRTLHPLPAHSRPHPPLPP